MLRCYSVAQVIRLSLFNFLSGKYLLFVTLTLILFSMLIVENAFAKQWFQTHNTWYEKIPENPEIMSHSADYVKDIIINKSTMGANIHDWSVPIWYATNSTPNVTVTVTRSISSDMGWNIVPIPSGAKSAGMDSWCGPQSDTDAHMSVVSADRNFVWDFIHARNCGSGWNASMVRKWDMREDGINSPYDKLGKVRAAPVPLLHTVTTYDEVMNGTIDHALGFAYWGERKPDNGVYPGESSMAGISDRTWAMGMGFRLQLDPAYDCKSQGFNYAVEKVCVALQEYGMIYVENSGINDNSIYFEDLDDKPASWGSMLADINKIPVSRLRVVDPIYPIADSNPIPSTCDLAQNFEETTLLEAMQYYTDREYTLTAIPSKYSGLPAFITPNDERNLTDMSGYMKYKLADAYKVYVAYDCRGTSVPDWMNGFTDTGDTISTSLSTQPCLRVYEKNYAAGSCVDFGANKASGTSSDSYSNYIVFYGQTLYADTVSPAQPPGLRAIVLN